MGVFGEHSDQIHSQPLGWSGPLRSLGEPSRSGPGGLNRENYSRRTSAQQSSERIS